MQTIQFDSSDPIEGTVLFKNLQPFHLLDNVRHNKDPAWMQLMNELRETDFRFNPRMSRNAFFTLTKCFCTFHEKYAREQCEAVYHNPLTTILVATNAERKDYIRKRLQTIDGKHQLIHYSSVYYDYQRKEIDNPDLIQQLTKQAESRFNLGVKLSLTNGAQSTVVALASSFIQIRVNKTGLVYNIERKCSKVSYEGRIFFRKQFPVDIADVLTIHKC
jgi:hypothetical protein